MGFDDFFENKHKHHSNYNEHKHHDDRHLFDSHHSHHGQDSNLIWLNFLEKIRTNNKLKILVALAIILFLAIVIGLIIVLFPFIMKTLNYISQNGIQGLIDVASGFLDKIMKGSGK